MEQGFERIESPSWWPERARPILYLRLKPWEIEKRLRLPFKPVGEGGWQCRLAIRLKSGSEFFLSAAVDEHVQVDVVISSDSKKVLAELLEATEFPDRDIIWRIDRL